MIKRITAKIKLLWNDASPTTRAFIIIIFMLTVGIVLRWRSVFSDISNGFSFFSK